MSNVVRFRPRRRWPPRYTGGWGWSWRSVGRQWVVVLVLLAMLAAIQYWRPGWTDIAINPQQPRAQTDRGNAPAAGGTYRAIDGDSFTAGRVEIRLNGIDAPEYRQSCADAAGQPHACGKMARDALTALLAGHTVTCRALERDRYGRQVSTCTAGSTDIGREMVRQGWAVAYTRHSLAYVAAEREARAAKRGMWKWTVEQPEAYRARHRAVQGNAAGAPMPDD